MAQGRLRAKPATLADVSRIVRFSREGVERPSGRRRASPLDWFRLGGPWMHHTYCANHLRRYRQVRGDVWIVETERRRLVGLVELWYDAEPPPFGRYAHIELLELADGFDSLEIENWLIGLAEQRAVTRGYRRFWCRPEGSGGDPRVLRTRGYREAWRNSMVQIDDLVHARLPAHRVECMSATTLKDIGGLLYLNHREAAGYRWGYLWGAIRDPKTADYPSWDGLRAARVRLRSGGLGVCVVTTGTWRSSGGAVAVADLAVSPSRAQDHQCVKGLLMLAANLAGELGARSVEACLPAALARHVLGGGIRKGWLWNGDPWFVKAI